MCERAALGALVPPSSSGLISQRQRAGRAQFAGRVQIAAGSRRPSPGWGPPPPPHRERPRLLPCAPRQGPAPQVCRFTSEHKELLAGLANVCVTTYTMISFSGKRSEESQKVALPPLLRAPLLPPKTCTHSRCKCVLLARPIFYPLPHMSTATSCPLSGAASKLSPAAPPAIPITSPPRLPPMAGDGADPGPGVGPAASGRGARRPPPQRLLCDLLCRSLLEWLQVLGCLPCPSRESAHLLTQSSSLRVSDPAVHERDSSWAVWSAELVGQLRRQGAPAVPLICTQIASPADC